MKTVEKKGFKKIWLGLAMLVTICAMPFTALNLGKGVFAITSVTLEDEDFVVENILTYNTQAQLPRISFASVAGLSAGQEAELLSDDSLAFYVFDTELVDAARYTGTELTPKTTAGDWGSFYFEISNPIVNNSDNGANTYRSGDFEFSIEKAIVNVTGTNKSVTYKDTQNIGIDLTYSFSEAANTPALSATEKQALETEFKTNFSTSLYKTSHFSTPTTEVTLDPGDYKMRGNVEEDALVNFASQTMFSIMQTGSTTKEAVYTVNKIKVSADVASLQELTAGKANFNEIIEAITVAKPAGVAESWLYDVVVTKDGEEVTNFSAPGEYVATISFRNAATAKFYEIENGVYTFSVATNLTWLYVTAPVVVLLAVASVLFVIFYKKNAIKKLAVSRLTQVRSSSASRMQSSILKDLRADKNVNLSNTVFSEDDIKTEIEKIKAEREQARQELLKKKAEEKEYYKHRRK